MVVWNLHLGSGPDPQSRLNPMWRSLLPTLAIVAVCVSCVGGLDEMASDDSEPLSFLSDEDMVTWLFECVVAAGHRAELKGDAITGRLSISSQSTSEEELQLFSESMAECQASAREAGLMRPVGYVKTEAEWQSEYARRLASAECLTEAGYTVDGPPSFEAYVDEDGLWSPHTAALEGLSLPELKELFEACPQ